jgi:hypothetical protein
MKLKKKHFQIANTISYFVDKNYYPNFKSPSREDIDLFMTVESMGFRGLSDKQNKIYQIVDHNVHGLFNGKKMYDLQIKMVHEEIMEYVLNGWGWYYPIASIISGVWPDRHKCIYYIKFLIKLMRKMYDEDGAFHVIIQYEGFSESEKKHYINRYCQLLSA